MATYDPNSLGIKAPSGGFKEGGWYSGRQWWGGTLSEPGTIHPSSNQIGAGQAVSKEVNAQSAAQQGVSPQQFEGYIQQQRQTGAGVQPTASFTPSQPSQPSGPNGPSGPGFTSPEVPNFPDIYKSLYKSSGISEKETQYSEMEKQFIEAKGKINDNPFLSEATRVGRVAKLEQLFNERTANIKNEIATKKADVETQLNLKLKQFDIESTAAQTALARFNALLQAGALDGASGEDIASITRSTGISSNMIYSAIEANRKKNVETQVITSTDDAGNVTAVVINKNTGAIISKQSLGAIGNKETGGAGSTAKNIKAQFVSSANSLAGGSNIFPQLVQAYAGVLSLEEIKQLYLQSDPGKFYGSPKENPTEITAIYEVARGNMTPEQAREKYEL